MASDSITVLHLVNHLRWGGVRRHVLDLREGCPAFGVRTLVAASLPDGDALRECADALHLPLYIGESDRKSLQGLYRSVRLLRGILDRENVRVLHMHSRYATMLGALASRGLRVPRLYTAHNLFDDLRWLPWYPSDVIAPTPAVAEHFPAAVRHPRGVRLRVIPHGVRIPDEASIPESPPRFCFVGRLCEEKGIRVLADALRLLTRRTEAFPHVDVIGDGPLRNWLADSLRAEPGMEAVRIRGYHERPADLLRGATALLFPSLALDAAPYVTLEAMALGVPVIASDMAVLRDLVLPRQNGVLVPAGDPVALADAIAAAARTPEEMQRLGKQARRLVTERHGWERMCGETAEVYRALAVGRGAIKNGV